ncbi:cation:proton antiporter [Natronoglycomyces albus]|uniref:Monovalent cation/H(+) antiporter subunit G n=1 Tax=Natronoglycomyces albus TaxID=2811108 RepID=A0A895XTX3_9ACTN|nr:monovalent cation/H(+) antiporter subunit G [Natronoglycomyces albus]QSB05700.1 monovalent cation/H(+) antiporter subunit G [Natronoglycomyces albus]
MLDIIGQVFIVMGGLIFVIAALGLARFPDIYTRASAIGTAAGLGVMLIVIGALFVHPSLSDTLKVAISIPLQLATSALGAIAIARSAYLTGIPLEQPHFDELADASGGTSSSSDDPR